MADALIQVVLDNLNSLIQREIALISGAEKETEKLRDTFAAIKVVLQDAELKQHSNELIKLWLRKLKQAAYQVDDILDDCAAEAIRLELKAPKFGLLNRAAAPFLACYSPIENVVFRFKIGRKIKDINESLDAIDKDRTRFGLRENVTGAVGSSSWRETISTLTEPRVLGRDSELESIVAQLVRNDEGTSGELSVLAIVGMGGLGKTTLAQMVFNDSRVDKHFELRIWVCVSDEHFHKKRVVKAILESVIKGACGDVNLDTLQRQLREKLKGKKYFLVLDDVWKANPQNWEELRGILNCGARGASVIVTTRLQSVASIMGTLPQRSLSVLSGNFKHLRYLDLSRSSGIRTLPDSICELVNLQTLNMNRCTRLENLPRGITRLKSLRHLYLNKCDSLGQMPPGIGELKNLKTLTLFVVDGRRGCGLDELQELDLGGKLVIKRLDRSISVSAGNINLVGKRKIRKLKLRWESDCVSEAESESQEQLLEALQPHPNLQSLRIDGYGGSSFPSWMRTPIPTLQNLRSIELENCKNCQHFPPLGQLAYLKVLGIAGMEKVRVLEDDLYACAGLSSSSSSVGRFPSLKALNIERLPCLEKLCEGRDGDGDAFPRLSTLSIMDCPKLKNLPCILSLKDLILWGGTSSLLSSISNLPHLTSLYVDGNEEDVCFPEGFLQGLTSLQSLTVAAFAKLQVLPTQLQNLSALKSLAIDWCVELELLPETGIQGLKSLQVLRIVDCAKFKCLPEALPRLTSLQSLGIGSLPALTTLPDGLGRLTSLQSLEIWTCPNLASLPHAIQSLTNLKSLEIVGCPQLKSRYSSERGEEYHQIAHVPRVRFW